MFFNSLLIIFNNELLEKLFQFVEVSLEKESEKHFIIKDIPISKRGSIWNKGF